MPFGLRSAPATFCRLMGKVLAGLNYLDCLVYMEDMMVFSPDIESHVAKLTRVFDRLREHNLMVNPFKTHLFQRKTTYLGHQIDGEGIRPDPRLVEAVASYPAPHIKRSLKEFLSLAGNYHQFIDNFAGVSASSTDLTAKAAE